MNPVRSGSQHQKHYEMIYYNLNPVRSKSSQTAAAVLIAGRTSNGINGLNQIWRFVPFLTG